MLLAVRGRGPYLTTTMKRWILLLSLLAAAPASAAMPDGAELACAGSIGKSAAGALPQSLSDWSKLVSVTGVADLTIRIGEAVRDEMKACLDDAYDRGRRETLWIAAVAAALAAAIGYAAARKRPTA